MRLSIGKAWGETRDVLRRDGSLIAIVALALLVLPGTLVGLAAPPTPGAEAPGWAGLLALLSGLVGLAGQIAISRIALGPPLTVGESIGLGFRRLPSFFLSALLWITPFLFAMFALLAGSGVDLTNPEATRPEPNIVTSLLLLLVLIVFLVIAVRMLFVTPAAAETQLGPIGLVKRSWNYSRGHGLKLLGLLLLVLLAAAVLLFGLGSAIGAVLLLLLGDPEPFSLSALFLALVQQILSALVVVGLSLLIARCYAQLSARSEAAVSVPDAGPR